jgi:hypothetical protein
MVRFPLTFLLTCIVFFSLISSSSALTIGVPGAKPTIQAGIDTASPGDTVLVQPGRYYSEVADFKGKNIVVGSMWLATRDSSYILNTIIDAQGKDTVFAFKNGETEKAELCGFTITHGQSRSNVTVGGNKGGGIYCMNSSPYLHHLIIDGNNSAYEGGGMYLENSNSVIEYCVIRNNYAVIIGNGLYFVKGNNQIRNCIINNNNGGGDSIYCIQSIVLFDRVLFYKNLSISAFVTSESTVNIINCTIADNSTFVIASSEVIIINSIFWNTNPQITINNNYPGYPLSQVTIAFSDIRGGKGQIQTLGDSGDSLFYQNNNISDDPLFNNIQNVDYALSKYSPCINSGAAFFKINDKIILNLNNNDYHGQTPDIGCFESNYTSTIVNENISNNISLSNFPNPFNASTSIMLELPEVSIVNLSVYSISGQKIREIFSGYLSKGKHIYQWSGEDDFGKRVASGIYILHLKNGINSLSKQFAFLK